MSGYGDVIKKKPTVYFNVNNGTMNRKIEEGEDGFDKATFNEWESDDIDPETGKKIMKHNYKEQHGSFTGFVNSMWHQVPQDNKYSETLNVKMTSGDDVIVFQMKYGSNAYVNFVKSAASVTEEEWTKPLTVVFSPAKYGTNVGITIQERNIDWFFKKDSEIQIPLWKKVKNGAKTEWDRSEANNFLHEWVDEKIIPLIATEPYEPRSTEQPSESKEDALPLETETKPATKEEKAESAVTEEVDDDLPF